MENQDFAELLAAVRAGDQQAAAELVRCYEPYLRRVIRLRLHDSRLRRLLDSMDVCQSILAAFFTRAAAGQFDLHTPEQLGRLLLRMALNKLATQARKHHHHQGGLPADWDAIDLHPSPSRQSADQDLLQTVLAKLSPKERMLFEQNLALGRPWPEIAAELGGNAAALRMCLARALARVRQDVREEDVRRVP